jgi:protein ImuB
MAVRTLVVWCPDWPVVATGLAPERPVAVLGAGRVVASSAGARAEGVVVGLRRRQAEARCPALAIVERDPDVEARAFEAVAAAVESFATGIEVILPGTCALATRGPSRYFGGDTALVAKVVARVEEVLGPRGHGRAGVADGLFAADQAARRETVVAPGGSASFLAPFPVATRGAATGLGSAATVVDLVDLWGRLGIRTLGDLAALPAPSVLARFGPDGATAHRLARGLDERPLWLRTPPPDLAVAAELDPPVEAVEAAAFVAKSLADELAARLAAEGLAATRVRIEAETAHGEGRARVWRLERPAVLAQRVRWQLEGWLGGASGAGRPTAGITLLRLVPEEVGPDRGHQADFWGAGAAGEERAGRGAARVQAVLGPDAVVTAVVEGARVPADQARLVPWGDDRRCDDRRVPGDRRVSGRRPAPGPWPGGLPPPGPATVHPRPLVAEVVDAAGVTVVVSGRGYASAAPAQVSIAGGPWADVAAWAGPWPLDERWWDVRAHRRRARWQMVTPDGTAYLLALENGRWWLEATYD